MHIKTLLKESTMVTAYHVTPTKNLPSILKHGLTPKNIKRGIHAENDTPAIYLFKTVDEAEDGVTNWLADLYNENESLALLSIQIDRDKIINDPELNLSAYVTYDSINPYQIRIINKNF